ncbi:hypothetical protein DH2020_017898 [Rehmannia glutinosa]|uniref:MLO-like protein n=1 Tax=Rehmannia glutinosa TaxID=99300 RepID=A0ABR0WK44_REHGL
MWDILVAIMLVLGLIVGEVPLVSSDGIHQLHIFIFVLAVFHVVCCIITLALGRAKMRRWKAWERETRTAEYQYSHDPERFRFARDTSFGRRHMSYWSQSPILLWVAHLAPQSLTNFDFQKYIKRTLEEDFKVVVGISSVLAVQHSWVALLSVATLYPSHYYLASGNKTSSYHNQDGIKDSSKRRECISAGLLRLGLGKHLHNWYLNFSFAFVVSDEIYFNQHVAGTSTNTLQLRYSSTVRLGDTVAKALRTWHHTARKQIKKNRHSASVTPMSSRPSTPLHGSSPVHLLQYYKSELDSVSGSPSISHHKPEPWQTEQDDLSWSQHRRTHEQKIEEDMETQEHPNHLSSQPHHFHHEINAIDFSFEKDLGV